MTDSAAEPERIYLERFSIMLSDMGMQRMTARVLSLFVCTDQATLTAPEIASALRISPAAVSGAVRTLDAAALIERVPMPGSRREHYRLLGDAWTGAAAIKQERFVALADLAADGLDVVPARGAAATRLRQMRDFYEFLADEMPALRARWESQRSTARDARRSRTAGSRTR